MLKLIMQQIKISLLLLFIMIILTGLLYPFFITSIAQLCFPFRANGSMVKRNNKIIGSVFIGQHFSSEKYFWSRPSATQPYPNNALSSSASNFGLLNPAFLKSVQERVTALQKADPDNKYKIPPALVTTSASGLDPHISPFAAYYQISRIARVRNISEGELVALVSNNVRSSGPDLLGEPRVNVLLLNYDLDELDRNRTGFEPSNNQVPSKQE